ncbi:MAG: hypothetical protein AAGE52_13980 [Myxococcota bacterium]
MTVVALLMLTVSMGFAQDQPAADIPAADNAESERASAFRAVRGAQAEQVPGGNLVVGAYGAAWVLVLGYFWHLGRLHRSNQEELARLSEMLKDADAKN